MRNFQFFLGIRNADEREELTKDFDQHLILANWKILLQNQ